MIKQELVLALVLAMVTTASAYSYDPGKAQHSQGYFELAQDPIPVVEGGTPGWEYIVDWFTIGSGVSGTSYEIWGFDNDRILNYDYNVSWYGAGWDGDPTPDGRIIMETWDGYGVHNVEGHPEYFKTPSVHDGAGGWEVTSYPWSMDNPWHTPSEYQISWFAFHTQEPRDAGYIYGSTPAPFDVMPIYNFWTSDYSTGLMLTVRIVTTEVFGADPGDSPIPTWTPWNAQSTFYPILGNWEAAVGPNPDFDDDGVVDADDIDELCDNMGGNPLIYDMDFDGDVDEDDLIYLIEQYADWDNGVDTGVGTKQGDFNLDGVVNATDLAIMKGTFGASGVGYADGNANCDDVVNATDLAILKGSFGFVASTGGGVPEPLSIVLLSAGGLALLRRKRR